MNTYRFDVRMYASVAVEAATEAEARSMIDAHFTYAEECFAGPWPNGRPISFTACRDDDDPYLTEINGEDAE